MTVNGGDNLNPERRAVLKKAVRLEVLTIVYLASVIVLMYLVMGSSQAMKTAWIEDLLSLLPPIAFLISEPFRTRPSTSYFPYGFHRIISIAFLISSAALLAMGCLLFVDSGIKLVKAEHPTIGTVSLLGRQIWLGWLMLPVLVWSIIPAVFIGRAKMEPARRLHNKVLFCDANMNKADWLTGVAAMIGVLGIAVGWWWLDATAALFISLDILHDGYENLKTCILDLMDRVPQTVDRQRIEALPARIATELEKLDWVEKAQVRMREAGQVFFGEVFITPKDQRNLLSRLANAREMIMKLDWRVQDIVLQLVNHPEEAQVPGSEK